MSSTRTILIFLGFIFLIIVILSSGKIAGVLRDRFGKFIPGLTMSSGAKITPTVTPLKTPTPTLTIAPNNQTAVKSPPTAPDEIPSTGPENIVYVLISSGFLGGWYLKKLSQTSNPG